MAYIRVTKNNQITDFPYSLEQLRKDNNTTSFPRTISEQLLKDFGVYRVNTSDTPIVDEKTYKLVIKDVPELSNDVWNLNWDIVEKSAQEKQDYYDQAVLRVKNARASLLAASDWTQLPDAKADKVSWAAYRQALRDITSSPKFPYLEDSDWPVQP
jgi:hypothetical protein